MVYGYAAVLLIALGGGIMGVGGIVGLSGLAASGLILAGLVLALFPLVLLRQANLPPRPRRSPEQQPLSGRFPDHMA